MKPPQSADVVWATSQFGPTLLRGRAAVMTRGALASAKLVLILFHEGDAAASHALRDNRVALLRRAVAEQMFEDGGETEESALTDVEVVLVELSAAEADDENGPRDAAPPSFAGRQIPIEILEEDGSLSRVGSSSSAAEPEHQWLSVPDEVTRQRIARRYAITSAPSLVTLDGVTGAQIASDGPNSTLVLLDTLANHAPASMRQRIRMSSVSKIDDSVSVVPESCVSCAEA